MNKDNYCFSNDYGANHFIVELFEIYPVKMENYVLTYYVNISMINQMEK
jgi:hypothetical protein